MEQVAAVFSISGTIITAMLAGPELAAYFVKSNILFSDSTIQMPNVTGERHFSQAMQELKSAGIVNIVYKLRGRSGDQIVEEKWVREPSCVIVDQVPSEGQSILPRDPVILIYKEDITPDGIYDWGESLRAESSNGRTVLALKQAIVRNHKVKFDLRFEPIVAPVSVASLTSVNNGKVHKHAGVVLEDDLNDAYGIWHSGGIWDEKRKTSIIYREARAEISDIDVLRPGARAYSLKVSLGTPSTDFDPLEIRFSDAKYIPFP